MADEFSGLFLHNGRQTDVGQVSTSVQDDALGLRVEVMEGTGGQDTGP